MTARQECNIIGFCYNGVKPEDVNPPMTEEELRYYESCMEALEWGKQRGIDVTLWPVEEIDDEEYEKLYGDQPLDEWLNATD